MIEIIDRTQPPASLPWRPFALGFRPFFLGAGLAAIVFVTLWLLIWEGVLAPSSYYGVINWHAHEMLFGFTVAVIAGFLLTAVRNWSGRPTATGGQLAALVGLWLAGRVLPLIPVMPGWLIAAVDIAFIPVLVLSLLKPVLAAENRANIFILVMLLVMGAANGLIHLQLLQLLNNGAALGIQLMLNLLLLLILMISGRVMPFFTEAALPGTRCRSSQWLERASFITVLATLASDLVGWTQGAAGIALLIALLQIARVAGWFHRGALRIPVLLVLYGGYFWLIVGLLLKGLAGFGLVSTSLAIHAFTVGALGLFTLGMMARVSLGHTGRAMRTVRATNIAFLLLGIAALVRAILPWAFPTGYNLWIHLSAGLWIAGFVLFVIVYAPVLTRGRVDGKPG